ncbi:MAG: VOC family protein [Alphaproteobacteria bacterium]|nr:VOC family protein [Alphaproteobacteria bacterium]HPF45519.1 VOC family protein [Emcibacteraceae bacterium]HRW28887.1 VOC family protein [Emcibacteraceae bacterium]
MLEKIHHVAYRCMDANRTVEFYNKYLDMNLVLAISEDKVPSTGEPDPYIHIFLDAGNGNVLAFFEVPNSPKMGWDKNTPDWVQHIAFKVADEEILMKAKSRLEKDGIEVIGPTNHHIFQSIYFRDPDGHRLELAYDTASEDEMKKLHDIAPEMMIEWAKSKKTLKHTAWLHEEQFKQ